MSPEDARAEAAKVAELTAPPVDTPSPDPIAALGLTTREVEVLRLLAGGRSNKQIGEALFISPDTVRRHLTNIYTKLGVTSRGEAIDFAHRHGLA
jgi:DNA-binding NarL/FixJ family response regulator